MSAARSLCLMKLQALCIHSKMPLQEIQDNKYDLSINRYKEVVYEEKTYEKPTTIITQIEALDKERQDLLKQLKTMLK